MLKSVWNGSTEKWINETHYTKDEVDGMVEDVTIPVSVLPVTITYMDSSTETIQLYVNIEQDEEEDEEVL